jgi:hypothetical protein
MDRNELPLEPCQLVVPWGWFKMIYGPMICLALTMHLSCTDTKIISKQTEMIFHMTHVIFQFHQVRPKRFMSLLYARHKPCSYLVVTLTLSLNDRSKHRLEPRHLGAPSDGSKIIFEPMVCSAQTVFLSCVNISTISKRTETRFFLGLVT